jgi:membrane protein
MQDDSHTDGRVVQLASGVISTRSNPGSHESAAQDDRARGRSATHPLEVPARGWKDILFRVWKNIGEDRVIVVAAGVTFYSVLALFPAIAALVAVYGFFADPTTIASHLDGIAGFAPGGAIEVIRDQITRVASQGRTTLGLTFLAGFAASLWSANAGMKSFFDALNLVYNEPEKRSFVWLNVLSLSFTVLTIVFALAAIGAMVVVPVVLNFLGLGGATDFIFKIARWPVLLIVVTLASHSFIATGRAAKSRNGAGSLGAAPWQRFPGWSSRYYFLGMQRTLVTTTKPTVLSAPSLHSCFGFGSRSLLR